MECIGRIFSGRSLEQARKIDAGVRFYADVSLLLSVSRLKFLCKALPIFDLYCADALKPTVDLLSAYPVPDDAHKEMPIKNIVIMFHQNLTSLWNKTIMSNYEFDTATEWLNYWFDVREHICLLADKCCACI